MPMTSPVDLISGPRMESTPGSFRKGNTDAFTATWLNWGMPTHPSSLRVRPSITLVAILARGRPMALDTKGTVLEARGLASIM